ncbi:hypothetical protein B0T25DRAFT_347532 [Lasiosphaeria hispida]|uniref:Zn(2)-C6 fungal-type domain-containing protein n=1 Tax=Lasiosphaeria hispida TaxID=260671 RepID=A0AAJ0H6S6_9PEZI|nr:hypothetical protein B0T25DRAFT_347532 [Lasiosphaeria hispida]
MPEAPGYICFGGVDESAGKIIKFAANPSKPSQARARKRFGQTRRKEIRGVRERGACLRCRLLRIPCSQTEPCTACLKLASMPDFRMEKKTLFYIDCIRVSIKDMNFFSAKMPTRQHLLEDNTCPRQSRQFVGGVEFDFSVDFTIDDIFKTSMDRLVSQNCTTDDTIVQASILCSPRFARLVQHALPPQLITDFQTMLRDCMSLYLYDVNSWDARLYSSCASLYLPWTKAMLEQRVTRAGDRRFSPDWERRLVDRVNMPCAGQAGPVSCVWEVSAQSDLAGLSKDEIRDTVANALMGRERGSSEKVVLSGVFKRETKDVDQMEQLEKVMLRIHI